MDKPIYLRTAALELIKFLMCETDYDRLQPYFGEKHIQLHYMGFDSFVLSIFSSKIIKKLQNIEDLIDFINLNETHEL